MVSNKSNQLTDDINETYLLQTINKKGEEPEVQVKPVSQQETKEVQEKSDTPEPVSDKPKETKEPARRKRSQADYSSIFLQRNELKARSCVYISQKIHSTIAKIVKMISDKDVTVGRYIDNILMEHLETHKDEITELYQRELKKESNNSLIEF